MTIRKTFLVVAIVSAVVVGVGFGLYAMWPDDLGRCIASRPQVVTSGHIYTRGGGPFSSPVVMYRLNYAGMRELDGTSCECSHTVTEGEYNRRMYGIEP